MHLLTAQSAQNSFDFKELPRICLALEANTRKCLQAVLLAQGGKEVAIPPIKSRGSLVSIFLFSSF
jgi:hypothetical protein